MDETALASVSGAGRKAFRHLGPSRDKVQTIVFRANENRMARYHGD
jgi:hypothetical protein